MKAINKQGVVLGEITSPIDSLALKIQLPVSVQVRPRETVPDYVTFEKAVIQDSESGGKEIVAVLMDSERFLDSAPSFRRIEKAIVS